MPRIDKGLQTKYILIYGAHLVALECYRDIVDSGRGEDVLGFAVTSMRDNPDELAGKPVKEINDYVDYIPDCLLIIAMPAKFHNEVETYARRLGFTEIKKISLELMSRIKSKRIIKKISGEYSLDLSISSNDPTWMDAREQGVSGEIRFKFPTLFYLNEDEVLKESTGLYDKFARELSCIKDINTIVQTVNNGSDTDRRDISEIMQIYMAFDSSVSQKVANQTFPLWVKALKVGSDADVSGTDYYSDNQWLSSISCMNRSLSEMTGAYWIWKQARESEYKGLCHYRRHFVLSDEIIRLMLPEGVDVLLTTPRYAPGGIGKMFVAETTANSFVMDTVKTAMDNCGYECKDEFEEYLRGNFYFPNNMVVAKREIYDDYCAWVFPVLLEMLRVDRETGYMNGEDRHTGYVSELLTSFYFSTRISELKTFYTDYMFYEVFNTGQPNAFNEDQNI